jgi:hypothetical protein
MDEIVAREKDCLRDRGNSKDFQLLSSLKLEVERSTNIQGVFEIRQVFCEDSNNENVLQNHFFGTAQASSSHVQIFRVCITQAFLIFERTLKNHAIELKQSNVDRNSL